MRVASEVQGKMMKFIIFKRSISILGILSLSVLASLAVGNPIIDKAQDYWLVVGMGFVLTINLIIVLIEE